MKKTIAVIGLFLIVAVVATNPFSVAMDRGDSIKFYHLTPNAGVGNPTLQENLKEIYPADWESTAELEGYDFDLSTIGVQSDGRGCMMVPEVTKNGQEVDDYDLQENKLTGSDTSTFGDIEATFARTFYQDSYWGYTLGCGAFNVYELDIPDNAVSNTNEAPEKVKEGETFLLKYRFDNNWKQMEADLRPEVCYSGGACKSFNRTVDVYEGQSVKTFEFTASNPGEITTSFDGELFLNADRMEIDSLSVDCDGDGDAEKGSSCSRIKIGTISGEEVTTSRRTLKQSLTMTVENFFSGIIQFFQK